MVKIAQVAGFLGSGKTTFLIELVKVLVDRGHKIAIIVNDVGEINVDVKIVEMYGLKAKEISGGCICCQIAGNFANTIAVLQKTFDPDLIIVEPSGVAIPWGLKRAAEYSEEEMDEVIVHAPVITLVDALRIDELITAVRRLVETQIREADVVFINKVDSATQEKIDMSVKFARSINPSAEIMFGSGRNNQGVKEVADLIETRTSPRYDETYEKEMLKKEYGGRS
ncbi:MAG TPA: molybdopterin-guanine dinucleotide biosynthesis protein MobB [Methanomassiliicoccales archaeon]|nr:molybdopterin-guanine dinucleotide biosynthesis protein MobB [Methanomassiliicoccales archaeon]